MLALFDSTTLSAGSGSLALILILARRLAQFRLTQLNLAHVRAHADRIPDAMRGVMDEPTYRKSIQYTLANGRFSHWEHHFDTALLVGLLFSGVLPWFLSAGENRLGSSVWARAGLLFTVGFALAVVRWPLDWYDQFRLEARFGFNTTTPRTWGLDRLKTLLLGLTLGYPLLVLVLKLVEWTGPSWWLWAWAAVLGFQLVMLVLAPVLILPLFNKFRPLAAGPLRERLENLAQRCRFPARDIQIMDGSRRSRHSNAFFAGFGRWRKIVLFDTLVGQLEEAELEAVLAHEIGHYRRQHILKLLAWSALASLTAFFVLGQLAAAEWFSRAFGFAPGSIAPALLLFALLTGTVTFWFSPLQNWWLRRFEYEADAFAATVVGAAEPLVAALRKLHEKNLGNLTPHPAYSRFYYSHPTLLEREQALAKHQAENHSSQRVQPD